MLEMALIKLLLNVEYSSHRISNVTDFVLEWALRIKAKVEESSCLVD